MIGRSDRVFVTLFGVPRGLLGGCHDPVGIEAKFAMRTVILAICCACSSALALQAKSHAETASTGAAQTDGQQQRGRQLRAEIDSTFKRLKASKSLATSLKGGNDVSAIVLKYVSIGASFNDAEAILRAAGCSVDPTPNDSGSVFAHFNLGGGFTDIMGHAFTVFLSPKTPDDFSTVGAVHASIIPTYS